jgi:hypothetical protein
MNHWCSLPGLLFCTFLFSSTSGRSIEVPVAVRELIARADTRANFEYCGSISTARIDYFLFLLQREELGGIVLIEQRAGMSPAIVDADTSLFPLSEQLEGCVDKSVPSAIKLLLRRRKLAKEQLDSKERPSRLDPEVSAIGREIDRVIYPISGFRLDSNSTHEILRLLRTGPAIAVNPANAPAGSIIVSPTRFSPSGPIYLGHAGIVGSQGAIYSADARYGGQRTKNFSLIGWLRRFSGENGCYAFVLHAPSGEKDQGF